MNCEAVHLRIDVGDAAVHNGKMKSVGRDRAVQQVVRGSRLRGAWLEVRIRERADHVLREFGRELIWRNGIARRQAPRSLRDRLCASGRSGEADTRSQYSGSGRRAPEQHTAIKQPIGGYHRLVVDLASATTDLACHLPCSSKPNGEAPLKSTCAPG